MSSLRVPTQPRRFALAAGLVTAAAGAAVLTGLGPALVALVVVVAVAVAAGLEVAARRATAAPAGTMPQVAQPPRVVRVAANGRRGSPASAEDPREWNLWELERRARDLAGPERIPEEWAATLRHLRDFARSDGALPARFDELVRESFPELTAPGP